MTARTWLLGAALGAFASAATLTTGSASADDFNWRQAEGQTVRVLLDSHPWQEALEKQIPEFEKMTGIKVEVSSLAESTFWDRLTLGLSSDDPPFDVFMLSPNQTGYTGYQNGWIAPLDDFINNPKLTNPDYDFADIYKDTVDGFRLPTATGKAYGIPISLETYMLFYRTDLFAEQGIDVSKLETVDDWLGALVKIDAAYKDKGIAAVAIRGQDPTMPDELLAAVNDYWGDRPFMAQRMFYFDENWNPRFTDPAVVKGFELWAKLLNYGPPGVENFTWYEVSNSFAQGRTATIWFDASVFAGMLNDPKQSAVVGKVGYAAVPRTETGHGTTHWGWGLAMTEKSPVKDAAWLFIQWATGKEMDLYTGKATFGPVRATSWKQLGTEFPPEFTAAADESFKISVPGYMYFDGAREVADRIIDAVIRIKNGENAETVMGELNDQAKKIVEANHLK
ncbi:MAG: sugar ABC transporter substrate-binding protein [Myxococcales bacterium]|nr:sugar ABC transporter substrate-binding protein [Myxococcales bacterium]